MVDRAEINQWDGSVDIPDDVEIIGYEKRVDPDVAEREFVVYIKDVV